MVGGCDCPECAAMDREIVRAANVIAAAVSRRIGAELRLVDIVAGKADQVWPDALVIALRVESVGIHEADASDRVVS